MSYNESIRSITLLADASLASATGVSGIGATPNSGKIYRFVKITTTAKTVGLQDDDEAFDTVGVLQNKPQVTGAAATVAIRGVSNLVAGGTITAGAPVTSDDEGRAIALVDGDSVTLGYALDAADEDELVPVLLRVN